MPTAAPPNDELKPASPARKLFQTKREELVPGTRKYWLRVLLAPICLVLVAGLHWYRVEFRDQTQWKGGGFAMFSTIDSPAARTLRFYLLTDDGEVAVEPPTRLEKWVGEMRAAPNAETLAIIAERMGEVTWVRSGHQWRTAAGRLEGRVAYDTASHDLNEKALSVVALSVGEPPPPDTEQVHPLGVRVELWRYQFDSSSSQLTNRQVMEYTHQIEATAKGAGQ